MLRRWEKTGLSDEEWGRGNAEVGKKKVGRWDVERVGESR